jgi:hypothetical protein
MFALYLSLFAVELRVTLRASLEDEQFAVEYYRLCLLRLQENH